MFPENNINYDSVIKEEAKPIGKSFLFDYTKREFIVEDGKVKEIKDLEAIKQWIELMLKTPKEGFQVYAGSEFGINLDKYIGYKKTQLGFVKSELKREIEETIILNRAISGIKNFECTPEDDRLLVEFTVILKSEEEVEVSTVV